MHLVALGGVTILLFVFMFWNLEGIIIGITYIPASFLRVGIISYRRFSGSRPPQGRSSFFVLGQPTAHGRLGHAKRGLEFQQEEWPGARFMDGKGHPQI
jgi:hypothetical protein